MKRPPVVTQNDEVNIVGHVFGTPLVVKGKTWLPFTQIGVWALMAWLAGRSRPERSWQQRLAVGLLKMVAVLGSEWLHNLAHAAAAKLVGKPMDAMRITWGMPLVVYYDLNDRDVSPREHIFRALGGPLFNASILLPLIGLRALTSAGTEAREVSDAALGMNLFLSTASILPIPGIDGGPVLKWSLVNRGYTIEDAEEKVKKVDKRLGLALSAAGAIAIVKRKLLLGGLLSMFGAFALAIGYGLIEE
jgi:Zn-dependent protease